MNYLTRVQALSVRVHSKAIASSARRRAIPARRVSFSLSDPARIHTTLCVPPCRPVRCVNRLFHPYLLSADTLAGAAARRGASGDAACCTPTHRRNNGNETQGRKRSRGLSGRSVRERVRVLRGASVDTATPTSPWRFKYKRRRVRRRRCRCDSFPAHLGYRMRVTHRWVSPLKGSGSSHTRVPFLHAGN